MNIKSAFEIIVPFDHNEYVDLNPHFQNVTIAKTPQLEGKALLTANTTPLLGVYELCQFSRRKIGLHGNVGHTYKLTKRETKFQIGKLKLWLFKSGIGFITIHINADALSKDKVLDLVSELCNLQQKTKMSYIQSIGKDSIEERIFTFKDIIIKLFSLLGEGFCTQIDGKTYKKAYCLFYGLGTASSEEEKLTFLEMLRNQNKSNRVVAEYNKHAFYRPFKYITWGVSERVLAAFCDVEIAGEVNKEFLTASGGLIQSVFTNYLLLYLNLLSANLKLNALEMKHNLFDPSANNQWSEETRKEISVYLNSPVIKLSNEPHINTLFDEYLYDRGFGLKDKHLHLSEGGATADVHEAIVEVKKQINRIEQQLTEWMDSVSTLVTQRKSTFVEQTDSTPEILEKLRSDFINSVAYEIAEIACRDTASVDYEESQLKGMFGDGWLLLDEYTRRSLISAKVFASNCRKTSYKTLDYSGIIVSATSALENELKLRFFSGYQNYLYKAVGKPSSETWPQSMLFTKRSGQVVKNTEFTMGSLPYIFGCAELERECLNTYLQTIMGEQYKDKGISYFYLKNSSGKSFIDRCEDVRNNYRNAAAHTSPVSMEKAEACCIDVIGQQEVTNQIGKVQGLLFDLVRITENYKVGRNSK